MIDARYLLDTRTSWEPMVSDYHLQQQDKKKKKAVVNTGFSVAIHVVTPSSFHPPVFAHYAFVFNKKFPERFH